MHPKLKENYSYLFDLETELAKRKEKEEMLESQVESLQVELRRVTSSLESTEFKQTHVLNLKEVAIHRQTTENLAERELLHLRKIASLKSDISILRKKKSTTCEAHCMRLRKRVKKIKIFQLFLNFFD